MNRTLTIGLAILFLALALILPIYALIESYNEDFRDLLHRGPLLDDTQIQEYFQDATARHIRTLTILAIVEVVFVILFVLALRASFKAL